MDDATALDLLTALKARLRYADDLNWFDPADCRFVEAIPRPPRPTVYAFEYLPTRRHLFLDERGRPHQFVPSTNPAKTEGTFRLHYSQTNAVEALRPRVSDRRDTSEPWDDFGDDWPFDAAPYVPHDACSTSCYGAFMRREITQRELRNESGEIMRGLDRGDEFIVTRNGVPVGELLPLRRKRYVPTEALIDEFRGAPPVDLARLRADLDTLAEQDPTPRG